MECGNIRIFGILLSYILSVFVSCILIDYIIKNTIYKILPNTPKFLINIEHYFKIKTQ